MPALFIILAAVGVAFGGIASYNAIVISSAVAVVGVVVNFFVYFGKPGAGLEAALQNGIGICMALAFTVPMWGVYLLQHLKMTLS